MPIINLQDNPGRPISRTDGCVVDPEAAKKVHDKYEEGVIYFVQDDNTVQVHTVDSRFAILFEVPPAELHCFRRGWIVPVTVAKCAKMPSGRCNFFRPHEVYVRGRRIKVVAWDYLKPAPK